MEGVVFGVCVGHRLCCVPGNFAMRDLVVRLPNSTDTSYNMSERTVGVLLCAIHQLVNRNLDNAK